ncbi:PilX N-terminal domain-containing pilus assembly protein [Pseudomonas sp. 21LCFQ010]|uniref:pilus assembly PilX family protein n=1 Tax=Pseudomonas sp. 21LCFQ010 TaxID=2957506 RepID=UPI0020984E07|nr:PilX N-terminal domain-containing pilus assembly protein [Pseudomonas sp. 21LCFQ010]MCO8163982.1 PilX N-terminal domain-containing pilus assembly protein [Pseudomonas sp. 21LCFQ010]
MNTNRLQRMPRFIQRQHGMALLVSLIFLLLLTMLGIASMQSATLQEKMAGSVTLRNTSFQTAEAVLRLGETAIMASNFSMAKCNSPANCLPPAESTSLTTAGTGASGVLWVAAGGGFYGIQNLGNTTTPISRPPTCQAGSSVTMYRVTAVVIQGASRTVLESIYANC